MERKRNRTDSPRGARAAARLARLLLLIGLAAGLPTAVAEDAPRWYKGNTHTHTFWSDGGALPERVALEYKDRGYAFLVMTDHGNIQTGERWINASRLGKSSDALAALRQRFGPGWVESRTEGDTTLVRLKTFDAVRAAVEEPGRFLLLQGEEVTARYLNIPVHVNVFPLAKAVAAVAGKNARETLVKNTAAVQGGIVCANHPNYGWALTAEDLVETPAAFFEVFNGHPAVRNEGDATHPGTERLWDIANSLRIGTLRRAPLYGIAADDAHVYDRTAPNLANPGRGFVMVRAAALSPASIVSAMASGDFYASTGVVLRDVSYDRTARTLRVRVEPEKGRRYTIAFVGTLLDADVRPETTVPDAPPPPEKAATTAPRRFTAKYRPEIGTVLLSVEGTEAVYTLSGREIYVRAVVTSDEPAPWMPAGTTVVRKAWTQPVGWEPRVPAAR